MPGRYTAVLCVIITEISSEILPDNAPGTAIWESLSAYAGIGTSTSMGIGLPPPPLSLPHPEICSIEPSA